ncbi:hypothetical protein GCM10011588_72880 [Nocardia jinanensis]|uniref:Uncharacterized protein n=1 Tax=Nocardia jinanensis TaxID=382504 RepID=A0A917S014_9NOCA|nr:hypothetical protein GCM10011588_72880 [Nocardia jinanensis]
MQQPLAEPWGYRYGYTSDSSGLDSSSMEPKLYKHLLAVLYNGGSNEYSAARIPSGPCTPRCTKGLVPTLSGGRWPEGQSRPRRDPRIGPLLRGCRIGRAADCGRTSAS